MKIRQSQIKILSLSETVYKSTLSNWHILWATNATASEQKSDIIIGKWREGCCAGARKGYLNVNEPFWRPLKHSGSEKSLVKDHNDKNNKKKKNLRKKYDFYIYL